LVARRAKKPVLKSSGKREEHKPSRRRAVALLTAVQRILEESPALAPDH
jgi:hypothetical protein